MQVPQFVVNPPQPSGCGPHVPAGNAEHVFGVQATDPPPHTLATPAPPHVCGAVQLPQLVVSPPQPSGMGPHRLGKSAHVLGTHLAGLPQTLGTPPPPHVWFPVHEPQFGVSPPHPSGSGPQAPG